MCSFLVWNWCLWPEGTHIDLQRCLSLVRHVTTRQILMKYHTSRLNLAGRNLGTCREIEQLQNIKPIITWSRRESSVFDRMKWHFQKSRKSPLVNKWNFQGGFPRNMVKLMWSLLTREIVQISRLLLILACFFLQPKYKQAFLKKK
jgi:hypothetical protein